MKKSEMASEIRAAREMRKIRRRDGWVNPSPLTVLAEVADLLDEAVALLRSCNFSQKWAEDREVFLDKVRT